MVEVLDGKNLPRVVDDSEIDEDKIKCEFFGKHCRNLFSLPNKKMREEHCCRCPKGCIRYHINYEMDRQDKGRKYPYGRPNYELLEERLEEF